MDSAQPKRVSKACDACKLRKVKCNGHERCQQCSHLGLRCVYSISNKTRSQGKRGRIITEYKKKTSTAAVTSPPILPAIAGQVALPQRVPSLAFSEELDGVNSPIEPGFQYDQSFFLDLIPDYMEGVYPVQPVIPEAELRDYIASMDVDQELRTFVCTFGACTLNLTRAGDNRTDEVLHNIETLTNYAISTLKPVYKTFRSSVIRAMSSMFIHNCLMSMAASDAAFHYIRDAITAIQLMRVDNADTMAQLSPPERSRRQRLYWQAYIHERFLAILDYRNAILPPLSTLPEADPNIPVQVHDGFIQIIKLFRLLDPEFIQNWLGSQGNVTSTWIEEKTRELDGDEESNARELANLSTMQRADLAITREWLRTLIWRLAMGKSLLSSKSSKECLSLLFPVRLSQNLRQQVTSMSRHDIEVHGSSIVQKLFEITDTISDVLIHVPATTLEETSLRIDDFLFILNFVLQFPTLDATRRGILLEKLERLQGLFPEVVSNASSPNLPIELQSPTTDPWYQVAQSKIGPDTNMDPAGLQGLAPLPYMGQSEPHPKANQHAATWNHISRRLSMAHFPVS
ncbi:hypothetical protein SLS60_009522 [Paraconiothyrium brasiliense]|uniref:Zn(2)-C6 fungal-type domain-containing protein n=1 Tax=Paraconiothyrium brasiliense TaxID=300254 RepID=A0ABR3QUJ9_9PLEO